MGDETDQQSADADGKNNPLQGVIDIHLKQAGCGQRSNCRAIAQLGIGNAEHRLGRAGHNPPNNRQHAPWRDVFEIDMAHSRTR